MKYKLVIGSRGSKLALKQAEWVKDKLTLLNPELEITIQIVKTTGDVKSEPLSVIGGKGVFTKELEEALLERQIDLAVHSLKDLPTFVPDALTIAAIADREDPRDALVFGHDLGSTPIRSIADLPKNAVVGTSSQRRAAQLRLHRQDLVIKELRGNVDTRLRKLDDGQYDALILAIAGLRRLGLENRIGHPVSTEEMLPAVGQGAIGIETRVDNESAIVVTRQLEDQTTRTAVTAERAFLQALGGGCLLPIAALAVVHQDEMKLEGLVASPDGARVLRDTTLGACSDAIRLGESLAQRLLDQGAGSMLATPAKGSDLHQ